MKEASPPVVQSVDKAEVVEVGVQAFTGYGGFLNRNTGGGAG